MKYINNFKIFEHSRNEAIPELIENKDGLAIFLIGAPGIGKSYFMNNFIHPKNTNIKDFSTDDISLLYTKDPNVYHKPVGKKSASQLNLAKLNLFMKTGQSFVYDTTGAGEVGTDSGYEHVKSIFDEAIKNNYKTIFIHILSSLQTSIDQDKLRNRHVDIDYIKWAYAKQMGGEIDDVKVTGNMERYKALNPDSYYVIVSINKKYNFFKFIDGKLAKKKGDKYIIKETLSVSANFPEEIDYDEHIQTLEEIALELKQDYDYVIDISNSSDEIFVQIGKGNRSQFFDTKDDEEAYNEFVLRCERYMYDNFDLKTKKMGANHLLIFSARGYKPSLPPIHLY